MFFAALVDFVASVLLGAFVDFVASVLFAAFASLAVSVLLDALVDLDASVFLEVLEDLAAYELLDVFSLSELEAFSSPSSFLFPFVPFSPSSGKSVSRLSVSMPEVLKEKAA